MKRLLPYLKNYRKECILAPVFKMLEAVLELFVPLVVAAMIDKGMGLSNRKYLVMMTALLLFLALVGLTVSIIAQFFAARAAVGFATGVRSALFRHLQRFSYTQIDSMGTSTMITRMTSDITLAQNGVNMVLRLLLRSPFVVLGAMIMAFTIDVWSAFLFVAVIFALSAAVFLIMNYHIPMMQQVQKRVDALTQTVRENLKGVRVLRAFVKEQDQIGRFRSKNEALLSAQKKTGMVAGLLNPLTYVIVNLGIILLIRTGAVQVGRGRLTNGQVVALYNYMSQILIELIKLANLIVTVNKALAGARRIADALAMPAIEPQKLTDANYLERVEGAAAVSFENVSLTYQGAGQAALCDITFSASDGQIIGIIGGTGCGKTSLVNLIPHFYEATGGSVKIYGRDVRDYTEQQLLSMIAVVPQKAVLFAGSIADNLKWGNDHADDHAMLEAVGIAQATDMVSAKGGLEGMVEQNGRNLSGGQKQRLTIARAVVGKKPILILDDSSSALDMATDRRLRDAIAALKPRPLTFIVSQRTTSISHADLILVMDNGRIVGSGKHEMLLESCEVYREIYDSQNAPMQGGQAV